MNPRYLLLCACACALHMPARAQTSAVVANPLEWAVFAEGNYLINSQVKKQTQHQLATAALQNTIAGEYTKIHQWQAKYNSYLQTASGFASSLRASTTLYNEGVRIFLSLAQARTAIAANPQGLLATATLNNLYLETATEMVSVYTLLRTSVAQGGANNMLSGAERAQMLWAINDRLHSFHKKLQRLTLSISHYTLTDVWNSATAGILDRDPATIAQQAHARWIRTARLTH